jgi:hypothetical protein
MALSVKQRAAGFSHMRQAHLNNLIESQELFTGKGKAKAGSYNPKLFQRSEI